MFDSTKSGRIEKEKVRTILNTLGHTFDDHELEVLLKQEDDEGIVYPATTKKAPLSPFRRHSKNFWGTGSHRSIGSTGRGRIIHDITADTREGTRTEVTKSSRTSRALFQP